MTRLFLRFYFGVIVILLVAWQIQRFVYQHTDAEKNVPVVENALAGGARLARDQVVAAGPGKANAAIARLNQQFEYPVFRFSYAEPWLPADSLRRLKEGEVVLLGDYITIGLPQQESGLMMGELPQFVSPSRTLMNLGLGAVFAMSAIAIALLLRPVAYQLRAVERTAFAIAAGDLSARIETEPVPRGFALVHAFNTMADRQESLLQSQRELMQAVSHELRTPLARLRFATTLISTASTQEERDARLETVDKATQQLDDLVGELLDYARLDQADSDQQYESVNLNELFDDLIQERAPLLSTKRFTVNDSAETLSVQADRESLARAMGNLLSNAGRHARSQVVIQAKQIDDQVVIEVDDDGPGIREEDRSRVFQPFVRLENQSDQNGDLDQSIASGSGLGLALVSRIAERCGGDVTAGESDLGGAQFRFSMPKRSDG